MVEQTTKKASIHEAAADVLAASIRNAGSEAFGLGKGQNPAGIHQGPMDLGPTHYKGDEPFVDYTKGVPHAVPPGQTPPVGPEPMHTLDKDRGEENATPGKTQGYGGKVNPSNVQNAEGGKNPDLEANSRRQTNVTQNIDTGKGNIDPPWAKEDIDIDSKTQLDGEPISAWKTKIEEILKSNTGNLSEDVDAIFNGETVSEEFKTKATTIFETAVTSRVVAIAEQLEEVAINQVNETAEMIAEDLTHKVDSYLNYMVEEWVNENEIAIEKGLRGEIVEDFIAGLRTLFVEHYIDIPEDKVDLVAELSDKVDQLTDALNTEIARGMSMKEELSVAKRSEILDAVCEGLVQTQVEKVRTLAESVEYTTESEFTEKLKTIKESYFPSKSVKSPSRDMLNENQMVTEDEEGKQTITDPLMKSLVETISRTIKG